MDIINANQQKFEPYAAMVDKAHENLNLDFVDSQDTHGQIENDETSESIYSEDTEPIEQNSQVHELSLASGDFIPKLQLMMKLLQISEALTKNNVWCLMCYISGQDIM